MIWQLKLTQLNVKTTTKKCSDMPNEILMLIYVNVRLVEALILSFRKFEHFLCNCRVVEDLVSTFTRASLTVKFTSPDV